MRKRKVRLLAAACGAALALSAAPAAARPAASSAPAPAAAVAASESAAPAAPVAAVRTSGSLGCSESYAYHPFHPTIAYGMVGQDVHEIQCRLNRWQTNSPYACCGGDGVYGSVTRDRIVNVQMWCRAATGRRDIVIDGVVGPVTWGLLHAKSCWG